jgi:hypothetical protein
MVPKMTMKKMERERTWVFEKPAREERPLRQRIISR